MKHSRIVFIFAMSLALALVIAACGSSTGSSTTTSSGGTTPTASSSYAAPTATTATTSGLALKTATLTVAGKSLTVLTDPKGMTLYYRTTDSATNVCSGGCATAWPPLISPTLPTTSATVPGTFTLKTNANGSQVAYNGHLLYTFASDTAPGQANGEGVAKIWFVATTDLKA
ncbi:MAG TPA: hypothetical protein VFN23_08085 [Ktedonobacteraceae bacterium]|nr:hypothetical protein [Ktedonobacteraceae bacterium]